MIDYVMTFSRRLLHNLKQPFSKSICQKHGHKVDFMADFVFYVRCILTIELYGLFTKKADDRIIHLLKRENKQ